MRRLIKSWWNDFIVGTQRPTKDTEYQLPVELWMIIIEFSGDLRTFKALRLTLGNFLPLSTWKYLCKQIEAKHRVDYKWDTRKIPEYVTHVKLTREITNRHLIFMNRVPESVDIAFCKNVKDIGLIHLHGVKTLDATGCEKITDFGLSYLVGIQSLDVEFCKKITNEGLRYLTGIRKLNVSYCSVTNGGMQYLRGIHTLNLGDCETLNDDGLKCLSGIKDFQVHRADKITDAGLAHLIGIEKLTLILCNGITSKGINQFKNTMKDLCIYSCKQVRNEAFDGLKCLEILHVDTERWGDEYNDETLEIVGNTVKDLCIHGNHYSDRGLSFLKKVEKLYIFNNNTFTFEAVKSLKTLKKLDMRYCLHTSFLQSRWEKIEGVDTIYV